MAVEVAHDNVIGDIAGIEDVKHTTQEARIMQEPQHRLCQARSRIEGRGRSKPLVFTLRYHRDDLGMGLARALNMREDAGVPSKFHGAAWHSVASGFILTFASPGGRDGSAKVKILKSSPRSREEGVRSLSTHGG